MSEEEGMGKSMDRREEGVGRDGGDRRGARWEKDCFEGFFLLFLLLLLLLLLFLLLLLLSFCFFVPIVFGIIDIF